ncbi:MAG: YitT family protein [Clostridia bacterium]|nr:YitT family protein [Clostridia bacterium]
MSSKSGKNRIIAVLTDILFFIIGSVVYAAGINIFAVPNQIAESGVTGISIVINHLTGFPIGAANFLINIPLFVLAWIFISKKFVFRTLLVVAIMSAALDLTAPIMPAYTGDRLLATIFAGVITGVGLAIIMCRGATSGGTDIVGKLLIKRWPGFSLGTGIIAANFITIVIAAIGFKSVESALYALIVIFLNGKVIDYILYGMGNGKMLMIVTDEPKEISSQIFEKLDRGVSVIPAKGGFTGEDKSVLLIAVRSGEVAKLTKIIKEIDPSAFTIITEAGEILGNGFRSSYEV